MESTHFELEGQTFPMSSWKERNGLKVSYAYFCPKCGRVWARAYRPDMQEWTPVSVLCAAHPSTRFNIAGELYLPLHPDYNTNLPIPLQQRELELNLSHLSLIDRLNSGAF